MWSITLSAVCLFILLSGLCWGSLWDLSCPHACTCSVRGWAPLRLDAKTVSCQNLSLTTIPENVSEEVEVLSLSSNSIGHTHDLGLVELFHLKRLMMLDLSWNRFRTFRSTGNYLESLRHLNLAYNCLLNVEAGSFRSFVNLEYLSLKGNKIGTISPLAFELPKLKTLDLSDNKLAVIASHYFAELSDLRRLLLSRNHIGRLTEAVLTHMNDVEIIDLDENKISRIEPEAFRFVRVILELRLSDNHLHEIPHHSLESLSRIESLVFCQNPIRAVKTGAFKNIRLNNLLLCYNKDLLVIEEGAFQDMPLATNISIQNNRNLQLIECGAFSNVPMLRSLNLVNNSLHTLREGSAFAPNLEDLDLEGNPLICDCTLGWLQNATWNSTDYACLRNNQTLLLNSISQFEPECPPNVLPLFPQTLSRLPSTSLTVHCVASGMPIPTVNWIVNNATVSEQPFNSRLYVNRNVLNIMYLHSEDSGVYTCVAENANGADSRSFSLEVKDLNVRIVPVTVTSTYVTLSWNLTSGITNDYVIQYKTPETDILCNKTIYMGMKSHGYTLNGLQPGQIYTIWLGIQRDEYVIRLSSLQIRTKEHGFLLMLGIRTNYLSIVMVAGCAGLILMTCICVCGIRLYKWKFRQHSEMVLTDNMSQRGFAKSDSANSDLAFMTYVNVADETVLVGNDDESYE